MQHNHPTYILVLLLLHDIRFCFWEHICWILYLFHLHICRTITNLPDGSYTWVLYYDASVEYFGPSHATYGIITTLLTIIILLIPLFLLCLYPCRCFQRCLNHFRLRSLALNAFVDAFQGCYKDGTNGSRDCRYFGALHPLVLLIGVLFYTTTKDPIRACYIGGIEIALYAALHGMTQPYKNSLYNKTDMILLTNLLLYLLTYLFTGHPSVQDYPMLAIIAIYIFGGFPIVYVVACICIVLYQRLKCSKHSAVLLHRLQ